MLNNYFSTQYDKPNSSLFLSLQLHNIEISSYSCFNFCCYCKMLSTKMLIVALCLVIGTCCGSENNKPLKQGDMRYIVPSCNTDVQLLYKTKTISMVKKLSLFIRPTRSTLTSIIEIMWGKIITKDIMVWFWI